MTAKPSFPDEKSAARETARLLLEIRAVHCSPDKPYTLTSGWASPVYIDCRRIISFPEARRRIVDIAVARIEKAVGRRSLDAVAGGETAGIPFAAWIADRLDLPMLYVRKTPKGFGRMAQIEGHFDEGARVLLVEDLATDGKSKVHFCRALREAGAEVRDALVIFHYGIFPEGIAALAKEGITLHALATWRDVIEAAGASGYFDEPALAEVKAFLDDPAGWSAAHGGAASLGSG